MSQSSSIVTVDIHGQPYAIRSSLDAAYVAELAAYVDQKMRRAMEESPAGDTLRIAVLAAINIADECFRVRAEAQAHQDSLATRAEALERVLDLALQTAEPRAMAR